MKDKWLNQIFSLAEKADQKMSSPQYLKVLFGFWMGISLCGAFLVISTIIKFDWMIFGIGMLDMLLGVAFGVYYYIQFIEKRGRHQKPGEK